MGTSTRKLVYDFDRKRDVINDGKNRVLDLVDKIAYLNEAIQDWFESRLKNIEIDQKASNDLRAWKEDGVELVLQNLDENRILAKYPEDLHTRLNQIAYATKDCCPGMEKSIIVRIIESDDIHEARRNPYRASDFFYEQLNATIGKDGLILFVDKAMGIKKVVIDYYRKPLESHAPSLEKCDGPYYYDYAGRIINKDQDFESEDTFAANDVVDLAVLYSTVDRHHPDFQSRLNLILGTRNLNS